MNITNVNNLPQPLVSAVRRDPYSSKADISITGLIRPPRMRVLEKRHDAEISVDVSERIWTLLGQSVHAILERADTSNHLAEERLSTEVLGWKVSGQVDLYSQDGTIQDYKVTSCYSFLLGDKPEWEQQINAYAWLYRKAGFPVKRAQIVAILRDWVSSKAGEEGYPKAPVLTVDIDLWADSKVQTWVEERVRLHQEAEDVPDDALPHCTDQERWSRPDTWAVKKEGNKKAYRVFTNPIDAADLAIKHGMIVDHRKGENVRCERFCLAAPFCSQKSGGDISPAPVGVEDGTASRS